MSFSTNDLVVEVSNKTGVTHREAREVINLILETISDKLADNENVTLRNFGSFSVKVAKGKIGRNPSNPSVDLPIPPRAVVKFSPGKELREKVASLLPELIDYR